LNRNPKLNCGIMDDNSDNVGHCSAVYDKVLMRVGRDGCIAARATLAMLSRLPPVTWPADRLAAQRY
jgi:hypothetical protein